MVMVRQTGANVSLPLLTISHASDAKSIGDLGLVYQLLPCLRSEFEPATRGLYQTLPPRTRQRHRSGCRHRGSLVWQGGYSYVGLEWWHTIRSGPHHGGRCRKDFSEKIFSVGIAFTEHGGKTGRAMIKYPLYKKNALPYKRSLYPGFKPCHLTVK